MKKHMQVLSQSRSLCRIYDVKPQTYFSNEVNEMRFKDNPRYPGFPDEAAYDCRLQ
jgi:YHS domain-containing protein